MEYKYKANNNKEYIFKSKGELIIAKFLDELELNWEYEFPIAVIDSKKTKIWYPDFYLLDFQIIIEYFGLYGKENPNYTKSAEHKKKVFKNCGIDLVDLYLETINNKNIWNNWKQDLKDILYKKIKNKFEIYKEKNKKYIKKNKYK